MRLPVFITPRSPSATLDLGRNNALLPGLDHTSTVTFELSTRLPPSPHSITNMASFMSNVFAAGGKDNGSKLDLGRPETPVRNTFVEPASTPVGSPSKRSFPPGAHELPQAHETHPKLNANVFDTPIRLGRPQSVAHTLSPGKGNSSLQSSDVDMGNSTILNDYSPSKATPSSPRKHQGQENTPPTASKLGAPTLSALPSHAALSRQDIYQSARAAPPAKRFDTSRGLTPEELEILQKPNVRRMVNVTQLCKSGRNCGSGGERLEVAMLIIVALLAQISSTTTLTFLPTSATVRAA